ncbi:uncharacterized protein LOC132275482 isoform X2 [Cornus florida]|uniref:uncharacterized protein LOC132275482 isoform X2 n=1 Tax=Cornus florida TaxID=4283 RepID=UPI00289CD8BD|nr:uncharacterized protein LOC132275482 isoform X2 [Cornus florida]
MTMLPVCSATTISSHSQLALHGRFPFFAAYRKAFEVKCIVEDRVVSCLSNGIHLQGISFKSKVATSFCSNITETAEQSASMDFINMSSYQNVLDASKCEFSTNRSYSIGAINEPHPVEIGDLKFVESSSVTIREEELVDFTERLVENTNIVPKPADPQTITTIDVIQEDPTSVSKSLNMDNDSLSSVKTNVEDIFAGVNETIRDSANKGENALKKSLDAITTSMISALNGVNESVDNAVSKGISAVDEMGKLAGNRLTSFSNDLKEALSKAGIIAVDVLRHTVVAVEDSLTQGGNFVVYGYGSTKELLPSEIQNLLNLSEDRAIKILKPFGTAVQQVYIALDWLERSLGLDPNDPVVPFVLFLGTSVTLWGCYWVLTYGGYAGDLSPKSTLELLTRKENVVLIDVRPEVLRERDGIPDLRRAARFRYANVTLPEVDVSVQKLLKSGRDLEDTLIAAVTRNLKIVQRPYLVQGGFQSWAKEGLRIKELKPETTLTIFNEEAEAILEDISPTPLQVLGYGMGFTAAAYALLEWEKTLQLIGVVGLGQTIYRRIVSYEDSEDFKQDVRLLLAPFTLGVQAISWAAGKLETNRIGLPTSPSSSDIKNRVLQAAAKHESKPTDSEETQDPSPELMAAVNENVDLSET